MLIKFQELLSADYQRRNLEWHISKLTNHVDDMRNLLDTVPGQTKTRNRLHSFEEE